ncbi:hypothetical protein BTW15_17640 [Pseudomonas syringae pv. tomato]|uniref:DUF1534 domain-containing protein n=1 Tax=Pseudomonas syringae pv. tomato TaxID=323 RepID=A0AB36KVY6_PSEUB|nr:hypothetical protein BTW15_17640 [Pseudomonas syringae pv. tomato]
MPTRSVGTIVFLRTPIVPHAPAWECISGRSASNLDQRCGEVCDAERHELHANAERRHDSVLTDAYRSSRSGVGMHFRTLCVQSRPKMRRSV